MSAAVSVFKLSVQSVRQLQQHRIEVSFEMTRLLYVWTPAASHSISITRLSLARLVGFGVYSVPVSQPTRQSNEWDLET